MGKPSAYLYEFGPFRVDPAQRLLLRDGKVVPLTPKVFDTLLLLVEHSERVLAKQEMIETLWPDSFVEEANLAKNVSRLRRLLGEVEGGSGYIETLPKRGYRFVAEVREVEDESVDLILRRRTRTQVLGHEYEEALADGGPEAAVRSIAILPFRTLGPGENEYLGVGLADALITRLSCMQQLVVRPTSSVLAYAGGRYDSAEAARKLRVDAVLEGSVQQAGDRIRVTAQLVDAREAAPLWAGKFDLVFTDIFALQDAIAERVADTLALELTGDERELLAKRYTADRDAYELYEKGRFFWSQVRPDAMAKAIGFFEQAIRRDPGYALAHAAVADCYSRLPITSDVPSRDAFPRAKEAALEALELDERVADTHNVLGWIRFWYDWDWDGSEKAHRRALVINPNHSHAHFGLAHLLSNLGRHEEALFEIDEALRLDPLSLITGALKGMFLFQARRYAEAIDHHQKTLELNPTFWVAQLGLGRAYEREGRYDEAIEAFTAARAFGGSTEPLAYRGYTCAVSGRREDAERVLGELDAISEQGYVPPYNVALVHHGLGSSDEALKWLWKAFDGRDVHMVFVGVDPVWDGLRDDARFAALLARLKLPAGDRNIEIDKGRS